MVTLKKKRWGKVKLDYMLFALAYFPWVISWMFTSTHYKDILHPYGIIRVWNYIGVALLVVKLLTRRGKKLKFIFFTIIILIVGVIVSRDNGNASFVFYSMFLIISASNLDIEKIIKQTLLCQIFSMGLVIGSSLIGIIPNEMVRTSAGGFVRYRYGLGYTYATFAPNFFLSIVIEIFFLKYKKKRKWKIWEITVLMLVNTILYDYTGTRTTFILVILMLLFALGSKIFRNEKIYLKKLFSNIYIIMAVFSILTSALYSSSVSWMNNLNNLLSQRLRFAQQGLITWGVSFFGKSVSWDVDAASYNYVDSSYINILICYGILVFLIVIIGFTITTYNASKYNDIGLLFVLVIWAIRAVIDPQLFLIWFNPFMFYIGVAILDNFKRYRRNIKS